jgi:predicted HTH transcriptional regulator
MHDNAPGHELPLSTVPWPGQSESSRPGDPCDYRKARELILELGAASLSWLQRQLSIDRDEAARHIERMQQEGLISPPDALGRRTILLTEDGPGLKSFSDSESG